MQKGAGFDTTVLSSSSNAKNNTSSITSKREYLVLWNVCLRYRPRFVLIKPRLQRGNHITAFHRVPSKVTLWEIAENEEHSSAFQCVFPLGSSRTGFESITSRDLNQIDHLCFIFTSTALWVSTILEKTEVIFFRNDFLSGFFTVYLQAICHRCEPGSDEYSKTDRALAAINKVKIFLLLFFFLVLLPCHFTHHHEGTLTTKFAGTLLDQNFVQVDMS